MQRQPAARDDAREPAQVVAHARSCEADLFQVIILLEQVDEHAQLDGHQRVLIVVEAHRMGARALQADEATARLVLGCSRPEKRRHRQDEFLDDQRLDAHLAHVALHGTAGLVEVEGLPRLVQHLAHERRAAAARAPEEGAQAARRRARVLGAAPRGPPRPVVRPAFLLSVSV